MGVLTVGVLALQGDFAKHLGMLFTIGVRTKEVRYPKDLPGCDALILPGGESTAIMRLLKYLDFLDPLKEFAQQKPLFGTCAGLILMSRGIAKDPMVPLGILDVTVERNAYGRQ